MAYFIRKGNNFFITDEAALNISERLEPGNYLVQFSPNVGIFAQSIDSFTLPEKIYGNPPKLVDRFLHTYSSRSGGTGVLLHGEKGSGKTLTIKKLSVKGATLGMPTLVITDPIPIEVLSTFLQEIQQDCIVLFDEFDKTYGEGSQNDLLTLLDGVFNSKKLYVFTCNDLGKIGFYLKNRPGRIYYSVEFGGLSIADIKEYCEDHLLDKSKLESVCKVSTVLGTFNFDMLVSLVQEINRYGESVADALRYLNIDPTFASENWGVEVTTKNGITVATLSPTHYGAPLKSGAQLQLVPDEFVGKTNTEDYLDAVDVALSDSRKPSNVLLYVQPEMFTGIDFETGDLSFSSDEHNITFRKSSGLSKKALEDLLLSKAASNEA